MIKNLRRNEREIISDLGITCLPLYEIDRILNGVEGILGRLSNFVHMFSWDISTQVEGRATIGYLNVWYRSCVISEMKQVSGFVRHDFLGMESDSYMYFQLAEEIVEKIESEIHTACEVAVVYSDVYKKEEERKKSALQKEIEHWEM